MIVVTIDEDMVMGGGIGITEVEVVVITSLLPVCANVIVATEVIVTGIVDIIEAVEELGCGVKTIDGLIKKAVVGVMLFVTLRKLLENPREGVLLYIVVMIVDILERLIEVP